MNDRKNEIGKTLLTGRQIAKKVKELGRAISSDYRGLDPVFVGILKGSVIFLSDLLREIDIECSVDFIALSSYMGEAETSGVVKVVMDLRESIRERHVVLIEDIVDTGLSMAYLRDNLLTRQPASFSICSLLSKTAARRVHVDLKYTGFEVPEEFLVGYGLDYRERYRNLPYIAALKPEVYKGE